MAVIGGPQSASKSKLFLYQNHQSTEAIINGAQQINNPHDVAITPSGDQIVVANLNPREVWIFENPNRMGKCDVTDKTRL